MKIAIFRVIQAFEKVINKENTYKCQCNIDAALYAVNHCFLIAIYLFYSPTQIF